MNHHGSGSYDNTFAHQNVLPEVTTACVSNIKAHHSYQFQKMSTPFKQECLGLPALCKHGFTVSFWMLLPVGDVRQCLFSARNDHHGMELCFDSVVNSVNPMMVSPGKEHIFLCFKKESMHSLKSNMFICSSL